MRSEERTEIRDSAFEIGSKLDLGLSHFNRVAEELRPRSFSLGETPAMPAHHHHHREKLRTSAHAPAAGSDAGAL